MNNSGRDQRSIAQMETFGRKAISVSQEALIAVSLLIKQTNLPLMIQPRVDGIDLQAWAVRNRGQIESGLLKHGAILFRGFNLDEADDFEAFIKTVSSELLEYRERSSPRSLVQGHIYTSTNYPADQTIFLHNENSYQITWPLKIFFFCHTAPASGGETPIADCRRTLRRLDPKIVERFREKKVMYIRNFGNGFGLPWQTVFQTDDKNQLNDYCRRAGIEAEWKGANQLRTRQVREAVAIHPVTGDPVWFNHAAFFHESTLEPTIREMLLGQFKEEDLPNNTYYGDGSPIEPSVLDEIRDAYLKEAVVFPWLKGDLLMLDNMLVAHGRAPFTEPRKILVGMADPYSNRS
jgi:alpha-ketoglutarate-dependent taurine dioxygenase